MVTLGRATTIIMPKTPRLPPGNDGALLRVYERDVAAWLPAHRRLLGGTASRWPRWGLGPLLHMALRLEQGCLSRGFRLTIGPPLSPTGRQVQLGQDLIDLLSSSPWVRE